MEVPFYPFTFSILPVLFFSFSFKILLLFWPQPGLPFLGHPLSLYLWAVNGSILAAGTKAFSSSPSEGRVCWPVLSGKTGAWSGLGSGWDSWHAGAAQTDTNL